MKKWSKIILIAVSASFLVFLGFLLYFLFSYYPASNYALNYLDTKDKGFLHTEFETYHQFIPNTESDFTGPVLAQASGNTPVSRALLFYPGAKVDEMAYLPVLVPLLEKGYPIFILKFPFRFAVFDSDLGLGIMKSLDFVENWTLLGHSLGGVVAGWNALEENKVDSLVYLASFPDKDRDLNTRDIKVLSILGTEDQLTSLDEGYEAAQYLPDRTVFVEIDGGNHAQFGSYGDQAGDGLPGLEEKEQQRQTIEAISTLLDSLD